MSAPAIASAGSEPLLAKVSPMARTLRPGANRAVSASQLPTTLVGATTRNGAAPDAVPASSPAAASFAAQISARAWTVLPRPMSSASTPPRPWRYRKLSQLKPSSWYGRSSAFSDAGQRQALDAAFKQPADGLAPRRGLLVHDAQLGELVPQPGLEAADLQRGVLVVLQGAGLVDQGPQLVQFRQVQREVGAAGQQHAGLAGGEGGKQAAKETGWPSRVIDDAQVEPVAAVRGLGGDGHHRGFFGFAVVGDVAGGIHRDVRACRGAGAARSSVKARVSRPAEFCRSRQARRAPAAGGGFAQGRHDVPGLPDAPRGCGPRPGRPGSRDRRGGATAAGP